MKIMLRQSAYRAASSKRCFATAAPAVTDELDVVIIGGGPGGYVAAIKAAQLGLKTACVESRGALGGTCLNVGCIPSKALLNSTHHYHMAKTQFKTHGITFDNLGFDLKQMQDNKAKVVKGLTSGIESYLFKNNGVLYVKGTGSIGNKGKSVVVSNGVELKTKNIIIATGSEPSPLPTLQVDNEKGKIVDSTGALELKKVPKHLLVVGGGVIGLELGSVYRRLGAKVTVVEFLNRITPGLDQELGKAFQTTLKKQGFEFKLDTKVVGSKEVSDGVFEVSVQPAAGGDTTVIGDVDCILVSTGRRPVTKSLGLDQVGIQVDKRGFIPVDEHTLETSVKGIYAIGDVVPGPMLAHKAEEEGIAVVETIAGKHGHVNYGAIPSVIYTHPEVASVGLTEEECKAKYGPKGYKKGSFPFMANSRAKANSDTEGMIKFLAEAETDRILGIHIIGPNAGEMIAEGVLALEYGASCEDVARTCHAHPTLAEAFKEAAMATYDKPIHM